MSAAIAPLFPLLVLPLLLQGLAMLVDEAHYHRARGLPRWERIGHPLDTLTVAACYAVLVFAAPSPVSLAVYVALAAFSCLFVTKDERVHAERCAPGEQWLHAVLFVLHPIAFGAVGALWFFGETRVAALQLALTILFGLYQTLYWNFAWNRRPARSPARTPVRAAR